MTTLNDSQDRVEHPYFDLPPAQLVAGDDTRTTRARAPKLSWRQMLGGALIALGLGMLLFGWVGISGTKYTYDQLTYLFVGGLGGVAAILIGATILVTFEHYCDRLALRGIDERIALLEARVADEFTILATGVTVDEGYRYRDNNGVPRAAAVRRGV